MFSSASPVRSLTEKMYLFPASCINAFQLFWMLHHVFSVTAGPETSGEVHFEACGTRLRMLTVWQALAQ